MKEAHLRKSPTHTNTDTYGAHSFMDAIMVQRTDDYVLRLQARLDERGTNDRLCDNSKDNFFFLCNVEDRAVEI